MGTGQSTFAGYDLSELEACTFFTKAEIIHIYKVFVALAAKVGSDLLAMINFIASFY